LLWPLDGPFRRVRLGLDRAANALNLTVNAALILGTRSASRPRPVDSGPSALVRHPLYLGEIVALAGVALQYWSVWALLLWGLVCAFQLQRMTYEERVLSEAFPEYGDYVTRTARLLPGVYGVY